LLGAQAGQGRERARVQTGTRKMAAGREHFLMAATRCKAKPVPSSMLIYLFYCTTPSRKSICGVNRAATRQPTHKNMPPEAHVRCGGQDYFVYVVTCQLLDKLHHQCQRSVRDILVRLHEHVVLVSSSDPEDSTTPHCAPWPQAPGNPLAISCYSTLTQYITGLPGYVHGPT
jgi:hypothetical protein